MDVLIVEENPDLGWLWKRHLERQGARVSIARSQDAAIQALCGGGFAIIVLDLVLSRGSALAIADLPATDNPKPASSL